jgi:DnaJ-class molecular chaperone
MAIVGYTMCPQCHGRGFRENGAMCDLCQGLGQIPVHDTRDEEGSK